MSYGMALLGYLFTLNPHTSTSPLLEHAEHGVSDHTSLAVGHFFVVVFYFIFLDLFLAFHAFI